MFLRRQALSLAPLPRLRGRVREGEAACACVCGFPLPPPPPTRGRESECCAYITPARCSLQLDVRRLGDRPPLLDLGPLECAERMPDADGDDAHQAPSTATRSARTQRSFMLHRIPRACQIRSFVN